MEISIYLPVNSGAVVLPRAEATKSGAYYSPVAGAFDTHLQDYKVEVGPALAAIFPEDASAFSTMAAARTSRKIYPRFYEAAAMR
ncbi:hypothetical protein ABQZ69_13115 [Xanthomonas sp. WHRI 8391]|uniref:hypothetical protein n=1 Tax=Xanthomonas TaxID=338 RepID=UPI0012602A5F|nr:hypothetical protein [Xanthomonas hortorum]MBG3850531.1 hypothetical protein [Xanthomonas hortorum pv. carotae]